MDCTNGQCCKHPDIIFLTSPKVSYFAELSRPLLDCCDLFCSEYLNLLLPLLSGDDLLPIGQSSVGLVIWTKAFSFAAFCLSASTSCNDLQVIKVHRVYQYTEKYGQTV